MTSVSQENQNLSQFAGKVFGDDWTIAEHLNEQQQLVVYVLTGKDKEKPGLLSHASIGLSDYELGRDKSNIPLGTELVGACYEACDYFDRALANTANFIMSQKLLCKPGVIFANVLDGFDDNSQMRHFMFAVPSLWEDGLYPLQFKTKTVLWLQALPISESEMQFAQKNGAGELGQKLVDEKADFLDLGRQPVI